jgi:hypothetical protein
MGPGHLKGKQTLSKRKALGNRVQNGPGMGAGAERSSRSVVLSGFSIIRAVSAYEWRVLA